MISKKDETYLKRPAVFILSTGRAGSGTFAHLFQQSSMFNAFHVPSPEMLEESFCVQQCKARPDEIFATKILKIMEVMNGDRRIYAETNPRLAFFAPPLNENFDALFIWIIRDPFEYVNSGLNRKWYSGEGGIWDQYRERPVEGWPERWGQVEKIAWQWCCINSFIETHISDINNVRIEHFSDLRSDPKKVQDLAHWAGATDLTIRDVKKVFGMRINVGKYSAPRDKATGDHVFGEHNALRTDKQDFDSYRVQRIIKAFWDSPQAKRYLAASPARGRPNIVEPASYRGWIDLLKQQSAIFSKYENLPKPSQDFRAFLRHDIDLFDIEMMNRCRETELEQGVSSAWFFLPPRDKRYGVPTSKVRDFIRELQAGEFEIGYHVNAWEQPGTYEITADPLARLDEDLDWFAETLGEPLKIAVAHGIPRHKKLVSNFSMYDALADRGIRMLDLFVIRDEGQGKRIPHFGMRTRNPILSPQLDIIYTSDSGGPIRREWRGLDEVLNPWQNFVLNTHCANYDIERNFTYREG